MECKQNIKSGLNINFLRSSLQQTAEAMLLILIVCVVLAISRKVIVFFTDDGIDTRIHGIHIKSSKGKDLGLNKDFFSAENLVRFPKLECFDPEILYRRSILLQR